MVFSAVVLIGQYAMIAYSDNMLSYLAFNWYFWFVLGATYSVAFNTKQAGIDIAHAKDVVTRNVV
jgi:hypothetical protein